MVFRIPDSTFVMGGGKMGSAKSPSDFFVFVPHGDHLHVLMVECKSVNGVSIAFDRLAEHQDAALCELDSISEFAHGFVALNMYDADDIRNNNQLFMVPIGVWNEYANKGDRKSLPLGRCEDDPRIIECPRCQGSMWDVGGFLERL
jgi:hypothetical protein